MSGLIGPKREKGAVNMVITVLTMTLFLMVVVSIHYLMLRDNAELASEELHNGTQIALSDTILSNQTEAEFGRQYIIETISGNGDIIAPLSAKNQISSTFNTAIKRNFSLGNDLRPTSGALANMSSDKKIQVLEFFVLERQDSNQITADSFRVYPYNCVDGEVGSCSISEGQKSTITGNAAKPYIKKITGSETKYPSGSTVYARVAFAADTGSEIKEILKTHGSAKDVSDKDGQMIQFDNKTRDDSPADSRNTENYHVGYSVTGTLPAVAVTEIMDITMDQNDGRYGN